MGACDDEKNIHSKHRERMRKRFLATGLESFAEHEVLELLLFAAIPRQDVNSLAHRLLKEFGSISNLFSASEESIMKVKGAGEHVAVTIKLIPEIYRYSELKSSQKTALPDPEAWFQLFHKAFIGATCEHVYMLCLDSKFHHLSLKKVGSGTAKSAVFDMSDIVKEAVIRKSAYVILAHNHTNGSLVPSKQDLFMTQSVKQALNPVGVKLLDHLIIADGNYKSILHTDYSIAF